MHAGAVAWSRKLPEPFSESEAFGSSLAGTLALPADPSPLSVPSGRNHAAGKPKKENIMTNNTLEPRAGKQPSHAVYHVRDNEGSKAFWTRIGSAWAHADGKGFNVQVETVPLSGRISLRVPSDKKD
ncbi:MAG: hypothetical protein ACKVXR_04810 [Planctomycetota bacterium]